MLDELEDKIREMVSEIVEAKISEKIREEVGSQVEWFAKCRSEEIARDWSFRKQVGKMIDEQMPTALGNKLRCCGNEYFQFEKSFEKHIDDALVKRMEEKVWTMAHEQCEKYVCAYFQVLTQEKDWREKDKLKSNIIGAIREQETS